MTNPESPSPVGWFRRSSFFGHPVPSFEHAVVGDVMRPGLLACQPETRLRGVAQAMAANHVHTLVVIDPGADDPPDSWRVVYDLDVLKMAAAGEDKRAIDVACEAVTVTLETSAKDAAELMNNRGTRTLIVLDEDGRPTGVVSSLDLAATLAWGVGPPAGAE